MDYSSCSLFSGDSRLPAAQDDEDFDCFKLEEEDEESLRRKDMFEEVTDPDILVDANASEPIVKAAGDLQNEVKVEEESDFYGSLASTFNAADLLCEPAAQAETFGYDQFPEEERKPFDTDDMVEDVKCPDSLIDVNSTSSTNPAIEYLQNQVKIEDESEDDGFRRGEMLNAVDLIDPNENSHDMEDFKENSDFGNMRDSPSSGNFLARLLFTCPIMNCPFSCKFFRELELHVMIHPGEQDFFCDVCKKHFFSKDAAMEHIQERKNKECCECGKKFPQNSEMIRHLRCHTGEKPYSCTSCEQRFSHVSHLKTHMLIHTGEKPFSCGFCEKRFSRNNQCKIHERAHMGEKPLQCNHCEYRCNQRSNLIIHMRKHSGDLPFACGHCEKRFVYKCNLKSHEKTHSGEKLFECKDCGRGFNARHALDSHVRIHTGEKPFSCNECDKKFTGSGYLKRHLKNKHQS